MRMLGYNLSVVLSAVKDHYKDKSCSSGAYCFSRKVIFLFLFLSILSLLLAVLIFVLVKNDIAKAALTFKLGGFFSVSLRSAIAEIITYYRNRKKESVSLCSCNKPKVQEENNKEVHPSSFENRLKNNSLFKTKSKFRQKQKK